MLFVPLLLLALGLAASAKPSAQRRSKVKESIPSPRNWVNLGEAPSDHIITLRIALPQPNFAELEQNLYEVSDPAHPRYGAHLSKEQVDDLVKPNADSIDAVSSWLEEHGIMDHHCTKSSAGDWVRFKVPVSKAEEMLDTKYHVWQHSVDGDVIVRTTSYGLPEDLHEHVTGVQPTTMFGRFKKHRSTISKVDQVATVPESTGSIISGSGTIVDDSCNSTITVTCLKELYNATDFNASATNGNEIGLTGYLEQFANDQDLQTFFADQVPQAVGSNFTVFLVNGGEDDQSPADAGDEANLDTQFGFGITFPTPGVFWSTGGSPPFIPDSLTTNDTNEPYLDWLDFVLNQTTIPQTISTSYGDDEQTVPESFAIQACNGFAQLGTRGVSVTFSSGDGGVGDGDPDINTQMCFSNNGSDVRVFIPEFPASCPFVTSVGATNHIPETAVSRFGSGGGFSNYFARPSYQDAAVTTFLDGLAPGTYAGLFNASGRGIPDVSAQGDFFRIFIAGQAVLIGGTSAASPTFAGIISLLNSARIDAGLSPLGFLNPLLYSLNATRALTDITVGNNPGCGTEGFNASVGWDPLTGLGTPNFGVLKDIVLALP